MSEAVLIEHEGQPGVFIPLNGKVKVELVVHPEPSHRLEPNNNLTGYLNFVAVFTCLSDASFCPKVRFDCRFNEFQLECR